MSWISNRASWDGCFFFSSRRRHTRLQGDWSSDVCSSDLVHGWHRFHAAGSREKKKPAADYCRDGRRPSCRHSRRQCGSVAGRSEEHTSELQSPCNLVCRLLLEKKKKKLSSTLAIICHLPL